MNKQTKYTLVAIGDSGLTKIQSEIFLLQEGGAVVKPSQLEHE